MPRLFATGIDLNKNELLNAVIQKLSAAPSTPVEGLIYQNTTDHKTYIYNGTGWIELTFIYVLPIAGAALGGVKEGGDIDIDATGVMTLITKGTAGTYTKVTTDAYGRVTSATNITAADVPTLTLSKISDAGTAASKNTGTASGNVPILDAGGKLDTAVLPGLALTTTSVVASQAAMLALTAEPGDLAVRTDLNKTFILKTAGASTLANWQELLTPTDSVASVCGKTGVVTLVASDVGAVPTTRTVNSKALSTDITLTAADVSAVPTTRTVNTKPLSADITLSAADVSAAAASHTSVVASGSLGHVKSGTDITVDASGNVTVNDDSHNHTIANVDTLQTALDAKAPLISPTFTGTPTAPTPTVGDNSTNIATTAFVMANQGALKFAANIAGTATSEVITHNLNTKDVSVTVYRVASPYDEIICDVEHTTVNTITLRFGAAPAAGEFRVVVMG